MSKTTALNVKGLDHAEKERRLFPALEALAVGDRLQIIFDFNPLPLIYLLNTRGGFDVSKEKDGPAEWILSVTRSAVEDEDEKRKRFKELLKELKHDGVSDETRQRAREAFQAIDARTLGILEQELISEGVTKDAIRTHLCDIHLEVMKDALVKNRIEAPALHPVSTLMEEHKLIAGFLARLGALVEAMETRRGFQECKTELTELKDLAHHLVEAEKHHQREEDVIFPRLAAHGITEPGEIMKLDHVEFRKRKQALYKLANAGPNQNFDEFKKQVIEYGKYLVKELDAHIFKEDNILYQMALQVFSKEEWDAVKKDCDKIGYCCYTPPDQTKPGQVVTLDLRTLPPPRRHALIFETWQSLTCGQILRIVNDHDPKPLYYQFDAEHKGKFAWNYEQQGPSDWIVAITRL